MNASGKRNEPRHSSNSGARGIGAGYKTADRSDAHRQSVSESRRSYNPFFGDMKVAVVFLGVLACALASEKYTTKYDNIDLDQILKSERLLNNYVNCLLDQGSCTPDGKELKKSLPDALENDCSKCSEKQKDGSEKVIRFLVNERPQVWERLAKKYDPNGLYRSKFENEATKRGIKI